MICEYSTIVKAMAAANVRRHGSGSIGIVIIGEVVHRIQAHYMMVVIAMAS